MTYIQHNSPFRQNDLKETLKKYKKQGINTSNFEKFNIDTDTILSTSGTGSFNTLRNLHRNKNRLKGFDQPKESISLQDGNKNIYQTLHTKNENK